jgi:long-subunit acyl-CoA synthetase (AMP-forming)
VTEQGNKVLERFRAAGVKVYTMYGQTEATARITILQDEDRDTRQGSVGEPIDCNVISIDPQTDEVICKGLNVFSGYAESRQDLFECEPVELLHTGDTGRLDDDGFLWITGRLSRMAKVNSQRVSLDELEQSLERASPAPVKCVSDDSFIYAFSTGEIDVEFLPIAARIKRIRIDAIPLLSNGKTDYKQLEVRAFGIP